MKKHSVFAVFAMTIVLFACGEAKEANEHLASMEQNLNQATKQAERIANSMEALQKLGVDTIQVFNNSFKSKPPAVTDDIDDILNIDTDAKLTTENKGNVK